MKNLSNLVIGLILGALLVVLGQDLIDYNIKLTTGFLLGFIASMIAGFLIYIFLKRNKKTLESHSQIIITAIQEISFKYINKSEEVKKAIENTVSLIKTSYITRIYLGILSMLFIGFGSIIGSILLINQNDLIAHQNVIISNQLQLEEANRRSSLQFMLSGIMDKMHNELQDTTQNPSRGLSKELINRITSLTYSFKPYRYLDNNKLVDEPLSPERGQLFFTLANSLINLEQLEETFNKSNFRHSDLKQMNLSNKPLLNCVLDNSDFTDVLMQNCFLQDLHVNNGVLKNADFRHTIFRNVRIENSDLSGANFEDTDLRGIHLKNNNLTNVVFTNAWVSSKNWLDSNLITDNGHAEFILKNYEVEDSLRFDDLGREYFLLRLRDRVDDNCNCLEYGNFYFEGSTDSTAMFYNIESSAKLLNLNLIKYKDIIHNEQLLNWKERDDIVKNFLRNTSDPNNYILHVKFSDTIVMSAAYKKMVRYINSKDIRYEILQIAHLKNSTMTKVPFIAFRTFENRQHAISFLRIIMDYQNMSKFKKYMNIYLFVDSNWYNIYSGNISESELKNYHYNYDEIIKWEDVYN